MMKMIIIIKKMRERERERGLNHLQTDRQSQIINNEELMLMLNDTLKKMNILCIFVCTVFVICPSHSTSSSTTKCIEMK